MYRFVWVQSFLSLKQGYAGNLRDYEEILRGPYLISTPVASVFLFHFGVSLLKLKIRKDMYPSYSGFTGEPSKSDPS